MKPIDTLILCLLILLFVLTSCGPSIRQHEYWASRGNGYADFGRDEYSCDLDRARYIAGHRGQGDPHIVGELFWIRCMEMRGWRRAGN